MSEEKRIHYEPHPDDPLEPLWLPPDGRQEVTDRYEHVETAGARMPLFRVVHAPRHPAQTDEQALASRRETEEFYFNLSVLRALAHRAADELGFPARCGRAACRRGRRCVADRDEDDWSFPGPWMPPCAATYGHVDRVRDRIREAFDGLAMP